MFVLVNAAVKRAKTAFDASGAARVARNMSGSCQVPAALKELAKSDV